MKSKIDKILLGTLWLLAFTMAFSFWMNTNYAFNIFSAQHWAYLSYLQAKNSPVATGFYVSIVFGLIIMLVGLYILIRPKFRKIKFNFSKKEIKPQVKLPVIQQQTELQNNYTDTPKVAPAPVVPSYSNLQRPSRPNNPKVINPSAMPNLQQVPTNNILQPQVPRQPATNQFNQTPAITSTEPDKSQEIQQAKDYFTEAGYSVKKNFRKIGFGPEIIAIGSDETIWLGGINQNELKLLDFKNRLVQIFSDTLDDVIITVRMFNVVDTPINNFEEEGIILFKTLEELHNYLKERPSVLESEEDKENFDAYSEYIDTVLDYIEKA